MFNYTVVPKIVLSMILMTVFKDGSQDRSSHDSFKDGSQDDSHDSV